MTLGTTAAGSSIAVINGTETISAPVVLAGSLAVSTTGGGILVLSGSVSQVAAGAGIGLSGGGELVLSGSNSYSGGTTVSGGTLQLGNAGALGSGGLAVNTGTVDLAGYSPTVNSLSGPAGLITSSSNEATLTVNQTTATTFGGSLSDGHAAQVSLVLTGSGKLLLSGSNAYSGGTAVSGGTLQLGNADALGSGSLTANRGSVDLEGYSPTISGLTGSAGLITNSGTSESTLTVDQTVATTFGGSLSDGHSARVSLVLTGSGSLLLSGTNNYSGGTTVEAGRLVLTSASALAAGSSLTVGAGAVASENLPTISAVPEPGTLGLLIAGMLRPGRLYVRLFSLSRLSGWKA